MAQYYYVVSRLHPDDERLVEELMYEIAEHLNMLNHIEGMQVAYTLDDIGGQAQLSSLDAIPYKIVLNDDNEFVVIKEGYPTEHDEMILDVY